MDCKYIKADTVLPYSSALLQMFAGFPWGVGKIFNCYGYTFINLIGIPHNSFEKTCRHSRKTL